MVRSRPTAPPLTESLRRIVWLLRSASSSGARIPPALLLQAQTLLKAYPIELAEARASPKQAAFQEAFLRRADSRGRKRSIFVAHGANRSGKTVAAGRLCFAKYLRDKAIDGDAFWCVAPTFDKSVGAAGGQQKELWESLPRWMLADQVWDEKTGFTHRKITLPTGDGGTCVVEFRSSDQAPTMFETGRLRGVWCDERLPEEIFDRLLPRLIDLDGFLLYSDIYEQWWHLSRLVSAPPEAGIHYQHFVMRDNAANLPAGAIEEWGARMSADERRLRIMGEMVRMDGLVFRAFDERRHLCAPFAVPDYWPRWRLIDYGSSAPTAGLWVALSEDEVAYAYREHYDQGHGCAYNARAILAASGEEAYRDTFIDPHAVDKPQATYGLSPSVADQYKSAGLAAKGWPLIQVMGEHACVERVKFRLDNGTLRVFNTLENLTREFKSWKHVCDAEGRPKAVDAYENANNHLLDCLKGWLATSPTYTAQRIGVVASRGHGGE